MDNKDNKKIVKKYKCDKCNYESSRKFDYDKHISTRKHKVDNNINIQKNIVFNCNCGNTYKYKSGLCKHKNKCKISQKTTFFSSGKLEKEDILINLLNQSNEIQQNLLELLSKEKNMIINNNSNNNTFNLQLFLNEKCKDALNITDFIDSLNLSLKDLENVGEYGFVSGISKIFINGLKDLDVYKRPIHCSDIKRETMYLKDQNNWEKDSENKDRLKKVVKMIANKNFDNLRVWKAANPDCKDNESRKNDHYMKLICASVGSKTKEEDDELYEKIIKNVAKEVIINKN